MLRAFFQALLLCAVVYILLMLAGCMTTKELYPYSYPLGHTTRWGSTETDAFYQFKMPHEVRLQPATPQALPTPPQFNIWVDIFEKEMKK